MELRRPRQAEGPSRPVLPRSCNNRGFYHRDGTVFQGKLNSSLGRSLDRTFDTLNTEYSGNSECVESVQRYLCYYYFPLCDISTGEITPVCDSNCESLFGNDDCSDVLAAASEELRTYNVPTPDESCSRTHQPFVNPSVSNDCIEIEGAYFINYVAMYSYVAWLTTYKYIRS